MANGMVDVVLSHSGRGVAVTSSSNASSWVVVVVAEVVIIIARSATGNCTSDGATMVCPVLRPLRNPAAMARVAFSRLVAAISESVPGVMK